ncbi:hypothetical protein [Paenibacillus sp. USHLN196]|uniref:hypothetical protein n=1 Tax=Paenibacillus sp. USHLN196 TaxID=3081291 RepID=UPI00301903D3
MKRQVGDKVYINPYAQVTGIIIGRKDSGYEDYGGYDYKIKLHIPYVDKDTVYTANFDLVEKYWWQFFNDDELDLLDRNYKLFS